jgi:sodium-coupled neutral amino acid transporter 11
MASIIGVLVTCGVMVFQWTKRASLEVASSFNVMGTASNPLSALVLMSMAATSYVCHFSAPAFLKSTGDDMADYQRVTVLGFSSVAIINVIILCAGFLTFGGQSAGIILNSYASSDRLASLCRLLMLVSIVGGYPILLGGAKSALFSYVAGLRNGGKSNTTTNSSSKNVTTKNVNGVSPGTNHAVTVAMLGGVTMASMVLENAGFVVGFNGATMGSAITYIFPSILAMAAAKRRGGVTGSSRGWWNYLILGFGVTSAIAGGAVSILSAFAPEMLQ